MKSQGHTVSSWYSIILLFKTSLPDALPFKNWRTSLPWLPNSICMEPSTTRGSASGRKHTGGGQHHWRIDRDRSTLITGKGLRVHSFRWSIPGKIWIPTNQIRDISARTHVPRELCARALQASRGI